MRQDRRYNPTDNIGRSIFQLIVSKNIGWIPREVTTTDVGIDFNIEEVVNGNPTARYLSIQLKTGLGNVDIDKNGDYIFRFGETHYNYWIGSSIPVIIAICNPDTEEISWELISKHTVSFAKKQYKILIKRDHIMDSSSLEDFTSILDAYQSDFILPELENELDKHSPEYWESLLNECKDAITNITSSFYKIHDSYEIEISKLNEFLDQTNYYFTQKQANSKLNRFAANIALSLNVSKCTIKSQIPIIRESYFEVLNSIGFILNQSSWFNGLTASLVRAALEGNLNALENMIISMEEGVAKFERNKIPSATLSRSSYSFATIIHDYLFAMEEMKNRLSELIRQFKLKFP